MNPVASMPGPRDDSAVFIERIVHAKTEEEAAALYGEIRAIGIRQALRWADGMYGQRLANVQRIDDGRVRSPTDRHHHE